jgi:hypothetical protein
MTVAAAETVRDISTLLDTHDLRKVVIIDDAYNDLPTYDDVDEDVAESIYQIVSANGDLLARVAATGMPMEDAEDVTQEVWEFLWKLAPTDPILKTELEALNIARNSTLKILEGLKKHLEGALGRAVSEVAAERELPDASAQILFIDYFLDGTKRENSLQIAKRLGQRIIELYSESKAKPVIILMSNRQELTDEDKATFRETANFVGGMFHYIPKRDLIDLGLLEVFLYLVTKTYPQGEAIAEFVANIESAASEALNGLKTRLQGLTVDDFGYIHQLTLAKEGVSLSDYVSSLLASFFNQEFRRRTLTDDQVVDTLSFDQLSFHQEAPSLEFTKLFLGVVSQPTEGLRRHPQATQEAFPDGGNVPVDIHFGDLFVKEESVLLVATAECDLICTPAQPKFRPFDPQQKVLLIPGVLHKYDKPWKDLPSRTEFVAIEGASTSAVQWYFKRATTHDLGSIAKFLSEEGFSRKRRLNPEFALDVQRMYFNDMGRIGLPVGPPIYRNLGAKLCARGVDGKVHVLLKESLSTDQLCVSFLTRSEHVFQLTGEFLLRLPEAVKSAIELLEEAREKETKDRPKQKLAQKIAELKKIDLSQAKLDELRKPFTALKPNSEMPCEPLKTSMVISSKVMADEYVCEKPLMLCLDAMARGGEIPSPGVADETDVPGGSPTSHVAESVAGPATSESSAE